MNDLEAVLGEIRKLADDIYANADTINDGPSSDKSAKILYVIDDFVVDDFIQGIADDAFDEGLQEGKEIAKDGTLGLLLLDIDRLHEAICEGRKQDAIDILNDILPDANLRPAKIQNSLFPDRVITE